MGHENLPAQQISVFKSLFCCKTTQFYKQFYFPDQLCYQPPLEQKRIHGELVLPAGKIIQQVFDAALVPWSSHWILLRFSKPWPPDTSFFHGLQLSTALPPKPHSQNVQQVVPSHSSSSWQPWKSQIPALRLHSHKPISSRAEGAAFTSPELLYFWSCGVRNTPKLQLCLSSSSLKLLCLQCKAFNSQFNLNLVCPHCTGAETLQMISDVLRPGHLLLLSFKHSLIPSIFH